MLDLLQILGAILVLVPFVWAQLGSLPTCSWTYLSGNLAGSSVLAVIAMAHADWGFLLLEGTWAIVAAWSLLRRVRTGTAAASPA